MLPLIVGAESATGAEPAPEPSPAAGRAVEDAELASVADRARAAAGGG